MREISLFLQLLCLISTLSANELHDHSLKHVQKRHDIPLEFIMNSKEHSDIRRSVRLEKENIERISSDKFVIRRDDPSSTEVTGDSESVPDKFDQPSYDFMLPEGKSEKSTILAVVDFITKKHASEPKFVVNFDENNWFDIGQIQKTRADNADVYKATVILKADADVRIQKTDGGLYKFVVEAQQGDVVLATTMISVDVLSLAPTTKRTRVTVPTEPKTTSSGILETSEAPEVTTEASEAPELASEAPESTESLVEVTTSSEASESTSESTPTTSEESPESTTSSDDVTEASESTTTSEEPTTSSEAPMASETTSEASESATTSSEGMTSSESSSELSTSSESTPESSDDSESLVLGVTTSESTPESTTSSDDVTEAPEEPTTSSEAPMAPESTTTSSEGMTSSESSSESSNSSESASESPESPESEEEVEVLDGSGDEEGSALPSTSSESPKPSESEDTSSELLTSSTSESESPIDGPVTILPLQATKDGKIEALEATVEISGLQNQRLLIPHGSRAGDMIRDCHVALIGDKISGDVEWSVEPRGILEIRPERVQGNEEAGVFVGGTKGSVEIIAKYGDVVFRRHVEVVDSEGQDSEDVNGSEMLQLQEVSFEISESLEAGKTVGSLEEPYRILNQNQDIFSLINGMDIILSCTDNCLKTSSLKFFNLILMPLDGSLRPLQVNIRILEPLIPLIRTSDEVIRISDNKIITKFAVITERTDKMISLEGSAAKFLSARRDQPGLYQLIVSNSAPSGQYLLEISVGQVRVNVPVHVSNSLGHAHFRKSTYSVDLDASEVKTALELAHVELEGVPIDEAKIMILDGNPGWVTVEEYGGKVKVKEFDGPIYTGKSLIRIGAVDKKTWTILTETLLEVNVINGEEKKEVEKDSEVSRSRTLEATFDREKEEKFELKLEENGLKLDPKSIFGIDEKGKRVQIEPTSITISDKTLKLNSDPLKALRTLSFTVKSANQKISVLIRLISSPEFLITQKKIASRPIYPEPWSREESVIQVEMNEELEEGQVIGVFPAIVPVKRDSESPDAPESLTTSSELSGDMKDAFSFDPATGELKIRQRIDYESLSENQKTFDLKLTSGEKGFESEAILRVKVVDVDDNSPIISAGDVEMISIPENLPAGSRIAELDVTDPDGSPSYTVTLEGPGSQNYFANITDNGKLSVFVADSAKIDRELESSQLLLVKVSDVSGNSDRILLPIRILDVNDNAPEFTKKVYEVEVVEDWPRGMVIDKLIARDPDQGSLISYSSDSDMIHVNKTTGQVTVAGDLWGQARDVPYKIEIRAEDSGEDSGASGKNSTAILSLRVRGKGDVMVESKVEFVEPKMTEILVKENIPIDTKIVTVKAETRGLPSRTHGPISYSLKDLINGDKDIDFAIDILSGDIFAVKPIDYERRKEYTIIL